MVRHPQPLPSSRNRNRVTFKTRLRIFVGEHQTDPGVVDEDEEKTRLLQRVLGVDQDDANEHHLQQVLSAAAAANAATGGPSTSSGSAAAAFIPTPDCTGIVGNYGSLYPDSRYKDPASFVCSSRTVEESSNGGLAHGICYYLDEKDKQWLDRTNGDSRGEGSSAPPSRASARSHKTKGKESELSAPIQVTEDEFELVMGLFELITHEETEYLHHSLKSGMTFPEFSNYQDVFAKPLSPNLFALFEVPVWIPQPHRLLRIAQLVYPYWKERRIERGGHRIIPILNGDESDTLNESYVCFRQREVKAVRKTRASQANPSEKLLALQKQLAEPLQLAQNLLKREALKRNALDLTLTVLKSRVELVNLKRANPSLGSKADEELLVDKEKPPAKKQDTRIRVSHHSHKRESASVTPSARPENAIRPSSLARIYQSEVETAYARSKELDQDWENTVDNPYVAPSGPAAARLFKFIHMPGVPSGDAVQPTVKRQPQALRSRVGRGGRRHLDRRATYSTTVPSTRTSRPVQDDQPEDPELVQRLAERWRFDSDDLPVVPSEGSEEQDRMLVDDFDTKHMRHSICLLADFDPAMTTDPSLVRQLPDGKKETVVPFKFGVVTPPNVVPPPRPPALSSVSTPHLLVSSPALTGLRKAAGFRQSPSTPLPAPTTTTSSGRAAMHMPHVEPVKTEDGHPLLSLAQLKTAFAASGEMAKYIPPNLRPPPWVAPAQPADSLRKPTPTTNSSAAY